MKLKKIIFIITILALGVLLTPVKSLAVLQANPKTQTKTAYTATELMTMIRNMETRNQAMGLEEEIDPDTKKSTTGSNNIDVHMMKTTEYGTVAILSASGYGNAQKIHESEIKTTTGNKSGVYINNGSKWEWTAGGLEGSIFTGVNSKYYDEYGTDYTSAKVGDALGKKDTNIPGCANWHGTSYSNWLSSVYNYFARGNSNVFAIYITGANSNTYYYGRAAVVCGKGI